MKVEVEFALMKTVTGVGMDAVATLRTMVQGTAESTLRGAAL